MKIWKKIKNYVFALVAIVAFISVSLLVEGKGAELTEEVDAWLSKTKKSGYTVTVIAQSWCSHCEAIHPLIEEIEEENGINIYWFDVDTMSDADRKAITEKYPKTYEGTPHLFITKSGKLIDEFPGEGSKEDYVEWLTANGVISE